MGIGRILGGALTGLGAGMVQSAVMADEERRQMALEKLRQENRMTEMNTQADLQDRNASRSDGRGDFYDARKTGRIATVEAAQSDKKFQQTLTLTQIEQGNRESLAKLQSSLNLTEIQQRGAVEAANEAKAQGSYVKEWVTNSEGMLVGITATGKQVSTNVKPQPKAAEDGSSILAQAGGRTPAPTAALPAPKTPAPAQAKATGPKVGAVIDGYRFKGGSPGDPKNWVKVK